MASVDNIKKTSEHRLSRGGSRSTYPHRETVFPSLLLINYANNKKDRVDESKSETNGEVVQLKVLRYTPPTRSSDTSTRIVPKYPKTKAAKKTQRTSTFLPSIQENYRQNDAGTSLILRPGNDRDTKKKRIATVTKKKDEIEEKRLLDRNRPSIRQNENAVTTSVSALHWRSDKSKDRVTDTNSEKNHSSKVNHNSHHMNSDETNRQQKTSESKTPCKNRTSKALPGQSVITAKRRDDHQHDGASTTHKKESRNTKHSKQQYFINREVIENPELHPRSITARSATTSDVFGVKPEYSFTNKKPRSKSVAEPELQRELRNSSKIQNTNRCLKAYNSVLKIPTYPIMKSKSDAANEATHSTKTSPRNRKDTDHSQGSSNDGVHLSLEELLKYKKTAAVYTNDKWQKTRKEQFYRKLEEMQMKRWRDQKLNNARHQQKLEKSKKEQMKQLRVIRNKHQNIRTRRLSTQHVKWKYVIGGLESDRKQYGLPSEYYTHYGFSQKDLENPSKLLNKVANYDERNTKSATEHQLTNTTLLPTEKERIEMRKRNKERYEHIFARRSMTQTDLMDSILKKGSYTVEVEEEFEQDKSSVSDLESTSDVPNTYRRNSKPLLKRKSRLVVGNVVDEARQMLDTLDERYSDSCDDDAKLS